MSIHTSLRLKNTLVRSRNVFRRIERLEILAKDGRREAGDSVFGLPKVRTRFKVAAKKKAAPKPEEAAAVPAVAAEAQEKPEKKDKKDKKDRKKE
ncbi:MAG: small basic protein [Planctomycetes bacterium]|nr:small basic protein [Planctomycetota bacterium]